MSKYEQEMDPVDDFYYEEEENPEEEFYYEQEEEEDPIEELLYKEEREPAVPEPRAPTRREYNRTVKPRY